MENENKIDEIDEIDELEQVIHYFYLEYCAEESKILSEKNKLLSSYAKAYNDSRKKESELKSEGHGRLADMFGMFADFLLCDFCEIKKRLGM